MHQSFRKYKVCKVSIATSSKQVESSASKDRNLFKRVVAAVDKKKIIPRDPLPITKLIEPHVETVEKKR
jgi:hypothetical protein